MTKYEATKSEGIITITPKEDMTTYIINNNFYTNNNTDNTIKQTKNRKTKHVANISITSITIPAHLNITSTNVITIQFTDKTEYVHEVEIDDDNLSFDLDILAEVNASIVYEDEYFVEFVRGIITDIYNDETILDLLEKYVAPEPSPDDQTVDSGTSDTGDGEGSNDGEGGTTEPTTSEPTENTEGE